MAIPGSESAGTPEVQNLANIETEVITAVWPNPSTDEFFFAIKTENDTKVTAQIFNMVGQMVHEVKDWDISRPVRWNASNSTPGIYFVKIVGSKTPENFKIIKK